LAKGKDDEFFEQKPDIGLELIDRSLRGGLSPGIVLIDGGYGNNTTFLKKLEERELKYLEKIAKNRKVIVKLKSLNEIEIRIDKLAKSLPSEKFQPLILSLEKPKKFRQQHSQHQLHAFLKKEHLKRVINASSIEDATEIDYFITNVEPSKVIPEWIVNSYSL
jgi:SRSO17 transposase